MDSPFEDMNTHRVMRFFDRLTALECLKYLIISVLCFKSIQVIINVVVLFITRNAKLEVPLRMFLTVYTIIIVIQACLFVIKHKDYFRVQRIPDIQENNTLGLFNNLLEAVTLFWYLTGLHWKQECKKCSFTEPLLYYTAVVWIYYGIFIIVSPLIAIVILMLLITYIRPKLPIIEYTSKGDIIKNDANCSICLADYNENEKIKILPCKHHFHVNCIDEWFNVDDVCPLCKKPINLFYDLIEQQSL